MGFRRVIPQRKVEAEIELNLKDILHEVNSNEVLKKESPYSIANVLSSMGPCIVTTKYTVLYPIREKISLYRLEIGKGDELVSLKANVPFRLVFCNRPFGEMKLEHELGIWSILAAFMSFEIEVDTSQSYSDEYCILEYTFSHYPHDLVDQIKKLSLETQISYGNFLYDRGSMLELICFVNKIGQSIPISQINQNPEWLLSGVWKKAFGFNEEPWSEDWNHPNNPRRYIYSEWMDKIVAIEVVINDYCKSYNIRELKTIKLS